MNLENIKQIVNSDLPNWETLLLIEFSKDNNVIPKLLDILDAERYRNKMLVQDLNALLSKAHVGLETPKLNKDGFMQKEIKEFYKSGRIGHCFKNMD
jgi:hypothetical protein